MTPESESTPEEVVVDELPVAAEAPEPETPAEPQDPMAVLQAEMERWRDLAYRNAAELDNFRKRIAREQQDTRAYANADLLRAILPILDNFNMGLDAARAESASSMLFMGMNMVYKQIESFLAEMNVTEVPALDQPFDPNVHEAVSQEAHDTAPEGQILRALRKGYKLKDRLLRPAMVVVSKGKEAPAPAEG